MIIVFFFKEKYFKKSNYHLRKCYESWHTMTIPNKRVSFELPRKDSIHFTKCISISCTIVFFQEPNDGLLALTLHFLSPLSSFDPLKTVVRLVSRKLVFLRDLIVNIGYSLVR